MYTTMYIIIVECLLLLFSQYWFSEQVYVNLQNCIIIKGLSFMSFKCKICCCPMKSSNSSFKWTENKFATTDWLLHEMDAEEIQQRALTLAILYTTLMLFISGLLVMSFTQYRRRKRLARRSKGEQNHEAEEENVGRQQPTNPWTGAAKERGHIVLFEFADSARIMYFTRRPTNYLSPQPLTLNRTKWISWSPRTSCVTRETGSERRSLSTCD